jgi:YHS domain-containing protein
MILKVLIWLGIIYLLYRTVRRWMQIGHISTGNRKFPGSRDVTDDLMVQDPSCGVYFLRKDGYHLRHGGKDLYFCSPECRDKYNRKHAETQA